MRPKMLTEHPQMYAGKCESVKSEKPEGKGEIRKWKKGVLSKMGGKVKMYN